MPAMVNQSLEDGPDTDSDEDCSNEPPKGGAPVSTFVRLHLDAYSDGDGLVCSRVGLVRRQASAGGDVHQEGLGRFFGHGRGCKDADSHRRLLCRLRRLRAARQAPHHGMSTMMSRLARWEPCGVRDASHRRQGFIGIPYFRQLVPSWKLAARYYSGGDKGRKSKDSARTRRGYPAIAVLNVDINSGTCRFINTSAGDRVAAHHLRS